VLLAHEVDERHERRRESLVVLIPLERVRAQRRQHPDAVVELPLRVDVEDELVRELGELPDPLDLLWACQADPLHVVRVSLRDVHEPLLLDLGQHGGATIVVQQRGERRRPLQRGDADGLRHPVVEQELLELEQGLNLHLHHLLLLQVLGPPLQGAELDDVWVGGEGREVWRSC
jgi:hypothetical protein